MTQDDENDYDIDDGAYFRESDLTDTLGKLLVPRATRERICEALTWDGRLKHDASVHTNCVRQPYPQGYHIDVPVYRIVISEDDGGQEIEHYELASGDDWVVSDAREVTRWFNEKISALNDSKLAGNQMRRMVRLTKKFARSRKDWKSKTASGISITKLVVDHFVHCADRDDQSLRKTWTAIKAALDSSTAIDHPIQRDTKLADADDVEVTFFRDCVCESLDELDTLDDVGCTREAAREAWDEVFDTTFFSDQPEESSVTKSLSSAFVVTSSKTAQRDDGGGRFG